MDMPEYELSEGLDIGSTQYYMNLNGDLISYRKVEYRDQAFIERHQYDSNGNAWAYDLIWEDKEGREYSVGASFEDGLWRYFFPRQPYMMATSSLDQTYHTATHSFESPDLFSVEELLSFVFNPDTDGVEIVASKKNDETTLDISVVYGELEDIYELTFKDNYFILKQDREVVAVENPDQGLKVGHKIPMRSSGVTIERLLDGQFEIMTEDYLLIIRHCDPEVPLYIAKLIKPMLAHHEG